MRENIFSEEHIETVFEKRNKRYGAYTLRKRYYRNLIYSFFSAIFLFIIIMGSPYIIKEVRLLFEEFTSPDIDFEELAETEKVIYAPAFELRKITPPDLPPVQGIQINEKEKPEEKSASKEKEEELAEVEKKKAEEEKAEKEKTQNDSIALAEEKTGKKINEFKASRPQFKGGDAELNKYINTHLIYPIAAKTGKVQGKVTVSFIIDKTGKIGNIVILKGIGSGTEEEVKRLLNAMPLWKPAQRDGKPIKSKMIMDIEFRLLN